MKTKPTHGHALALVLVALAAIAGLGALVSNRLDSRISRAREDELRTQAIWLARSAAARGQAADRQVALHGASAHVRVTLSAGQVVAEAKIPGHGPARATATTSDWHESFDAVP